MSTNRIFSSLPETMSLSILSFNTASEISKVAQVSRSLRKLINNNKKLYDRQFSNEFNNLVPKVLRGLEAAIRSGHFSMEVNRIFEIGKQLIDTISNPPLYYLSQADLNQQIEYMQNDGEVKDPGKIQAIRGNAIVLIRNSKKAYFVKNNRFGISDVNIKLSKKEKQQLLEQKPTPQGIVVKEENNTVLLTMISDQVWQLSLAEKLKQLTLFVAGTLINGFTYEDEKRGPQRMFGNQLLYPYGSPTSLKNLGIILNENDTEIDSIFKLGKAVLAHKIPFNWQVIRPEVLSFSGSESSKPLRPIDNSLTSIEQLNHVFNRFNLLKSLQPRPAGQAKPAFHSNESKSTTQITISNETISDVLKILREYEKAWFKAQDRTKNVAELIQNISSLESKESDNLLDLIDQAKTDAEEADKIANESACFFNRNLTGSRYQKALRQARICVQKSVVAPHRKK